MEPPHSLTDEGDPLSIVSEHRLESPTVLYRNLSIGSVAATRGVIVYFRWGRKCSAKTVSGAAHAQESPAVCTCARIWLQVGRCVRGAFSAARCYCTTTCVGCMASQSCQTVHNCLLQRCLALQKQLLAPELYRRVHMVFPGTIPDWSCRVVSWLSLWDG